MLANHSREKDVGERGDKLAPCVKYRLTTYLHDLAVNHL